MAWDEKGDTGTGEVVVITEQHGHMAMGTTATGGIDGTRVSV